MENKIENKIEVVKVENKSLLFVREGMEISLNLALREGGDDDLFYELEIEARRGDDKAYDAYCVFEPRNAAEFSAEAWEEVVDFLQHKFEKSVKFDSEIVAQICAILEALPESASCDDVVAGLFYKVGDTLAEKFEAMQEQLVAKISFDVNTSSSSTFFSATIHARGHRVGIVAEQEFVAEEERWWTEVSVRVDGEEYFATEFWRENAYSGEWGEHPFVSSDDEESIAYLSVFEIAELYKNAILAKLED